MTEEIEITDEMIKAGVESIREQPFGAPHADLVSLIYMAMEYQRMRALPSAINSSK